MQGRETDKNTNIPICLPAGIWRPSYTKRRRNRPRELRTFQVVVRYRSNGRTEQQMAQLYGSRYGKADLLAHVGDISQVARIKPYRLVEGLEDGVLALDVTTGSGLDFTVLPGRGMDISSASYNGRSLAWRSATTDTHAAFFDHEGEGGRGWLRGFYGGLVVTCGLTWAGANATENGQSYGLHGRIGNLPATNVSWDGAWEGDDYIMTVRGKMRQATVFGENLQLTRTITCRLGEKRLFLHDVVENLGAHRTEHMMLYHINIGFPIVNDNARLIAPTLSATPRDAEAVKGQDRFTRFQAPEAGFNEQVYFHEFARAEDGKVTTAIVDETAPSADGGAPGIGVYCTYSPDELPRFIEWKMMGSGTYVVGMEPANCMVMGRPHDRAEGTLQFLEPSETREYHVEIGVLAGPEEIAAQERSCRSAVTSRIPGA
jgi:hypothetical protein